MLKWFMRQRFAAFEREYDYNMDHVRDILAADPRGLSIIKGIMPMSDYCRDLPRDAWYAAKFVAAMTEDCGPCTQLGVKLAERAGVAPKVIEAILSGRESDMPADAALGYRYAHAVLQHGAEAEPLRQKILAQWGPRALLSLAFAITATRMFPTLKYALGHGRACLRVTVGGKNLAVERHAA
jgi:hypothetical protein